MQRFFFTLGRYPLLSIAEINAVLEKNNFSFTQILASDEIVIFEFPNNADLTEIFYLLGGSVKIGSILGEINLSDSESDFYKFFESSFLKIHVIPKEAKKLHFGISIYDGGGEAKIIAELENNLAEFQKIIKNNLKSEEIKSGFLRIKERNLSSVAVEKNRLLDKGFELVLIASEEKIFIGKTTAVQDFHSFAIRDMDRPMKDKRSGILPVKLARIMVNLALTSSAQTLLDPFCGSGTILMEAALLGIKNLTGTDISDRAVLYSKNNMRWLDATYRLSSYKYDIFKADIRTLENLLDRSSFDSIVTEPFLGPPMFRKPKSFEAEKIISDLTPLYNQSLKILNKLLKSTGKLVIIFPFIQSEVKIFYMDKKIIPDNQFKVIQSLIYSSPNQFVGREILVLQKN